MILGPIFRQCQVSGWNCKLSPQCGCIDGKDISRWLKVLILESILDVCRSPPLPIFGFCGTFREPGCVLQALGIALAEDVPANGNHRDCEEEEQVAKIGRGARSGILVGNVERNLRISSTGDP